MNWLTNFVRPKIRALVSRGAEIPDNLWVKCDKCGTMIFHRELEASLHVCSQCGNHMRIDTAKRLSLMLDDGFTKLEMPKPIVDPLKFRDKERYTDRLKRSHAKTTEPDAISSAAGTIGGVPAVVSVLDFSFMGGSMGIGVGDGFVAAAREAVARKAAFIAVTASGGARMQEGILSLMQLPRTTIAVQMVKEAGLPYIVLLTDPTTGGVSASFAMLGDVHLAEPGAYIAFAGARVIESTVREKLPEGFQRAEYLLEHGMLDTVVTRAELRGTLAKILRLLMRAAPLPALESSAPVSPPLSPPLSAA